MANPAAAALIRNFTIFVKIPPIVPSIPSSIIARSLSMLSSGSFWNWATFFAMLSSTCFSHSVRAAPARTDARNGFNSNRKSCNAWMLVLLSYITLLSSVANFSNPWKALFGLFMILPIARELNSFFVLRSMSARSFRLLSFASLLRRSCSGLVASFIWLSFIY